MTVDTGTSAWSGTDCVVLPKSAFPTGVRFRPALVAPVELLVGYDV
jgi:hypothetical protein